MLSFPATIRRRLPSLAVCAALMSGVVGTRTAPVAAASLPDPVSAPRSSRFT